MTVGILQAAALETLLGGSLDKEGLTAEALQRLCDQEVAEGEQLEFKGASAYDKQPKDARNSWRREQEFAKDVCAFANHLGGVILIGVEERATVAASVAGRTDPSAADERQRLDQALQRHATPAVRVEYMEIRLAEGYVTAVVVPPSSAAPHGVHFDPKSQRGPLCFPVRNGPHTRYLGEPELADRYQRRFLGAADRRAREQRIVAEGLTALTDPPDCWCYVAVVPATAADDTMNREVAREFETWLGTVDFRSPHDNSPAPIGRPIPGPGRLTVTEHPYTDSEDPATPRRNYRELHAEGAFFGARTLKPENGVGVHEILLADALILLVELGLRWARERGGRWGSATVICGLTSADPLELWWAPRVGPSRRLDHTRRVKDPSARALADLSTASTVQDRLVTTYHVGSALLQHFGRPEMLHLAPQGAINLDQWGNQQQTESWASAHDVATDNSTSQASWF